MVREKSETHYAAYERIRRSSSRGVSERNSDKNS